MATGINVTDLGQEGEQGSSFCFFSFCYSVEKQEHDAAETLVMIRRCGERSRGINLTCFENDERVGAWVRGCVAGWLWVLVELAVEGKWSLGAAGQWEGARDW